MTQKSIRVAQELQMKYDPILGTTYQLENVIIKNNEHIEVIKDCKHNAKALIHIGERNYCSNCGDYVNNPMNNK
jgi:D-ribose pyranose/furanose isomerase RbsD